MTGVFALVGHSLRRRRAFLLAGCLMLIAFQLFIILAARSLEESGGFSRLQGLMPEFLARLTNMAAMSFRGFVLFGYSHPIVLLFLIAMAITIGSEPAAEIESKFVDLLMARPVARRAAIARTLLVLVVATVAAIGCMLVGTWAGLRLLVPPTSPIPTLRVVMSLAANLALEVLAWGVIALVVASLARRRATVTAVCGLLAFATFVLDYVGRFWDAASGIARVSPFHYFSPFQLIAGQPLQLTDVAVLAAIIVVGSMAATVVYVRRDL